MAESLESVASPSGTPFKHIVLPVDTWAYSRSGLGPFVSASIRDRLVRVECLEPFSRAGTDFDVVLEVADSERERWLEAFSTWRPEQWEAAFWPRRLALTGGTWTLRWAAGGKDHKRSGTNAGPHKTPAREDGWAPSEFERLLDIWLERVRRGGRTIQVSPERMPRSYAFKSE